MTRPVDRRRTLEELEHNNWGPPPTEGTNLIAMAHALRRKPVGDLTAGDLRLLIGQSIGLRFLVPFALDLLQADPFVEGDFYEGDLLHSVLRIEPAFWAAHPELAKDIRSVVATSMATLDAGFDVIPDVRRALEQFTAGKA